MRYPLQGYQPRLQGAGHFIAPSADLIGQVVMENRSSVWFNAVLRADNEPIHLGEDSNVQDGCVLHTDPGCPLTLGRGVTVGHLAMLHGCVIGDHSLVGIKSVILNRARIGKYCLIAANSLIIEGRDIPDRSLVMGSPGKIVRSLNDEELEQLELSARVYVEKARRYVESLGGG